MLGQGGRAGRQAGKAGKARRAYVYTPVRLERAYVYTPLQVNVHHLSGNSVQVYFDGFEGVLQLHQRKAALQ